MASFLFRGHDWEYIGHFMWMEKTVWSLVSGGRTGKVFWEELKVGLKSQFSKNTGLTGMFQVRRLCIHLLWQGKFNILSIWPCWGEQGRQQQLSCTLKGCVPLSGRVTDILPCPVSKESFWDRHLFSNLRAPDRRQRHSFSFTHSAEAREDWLCGSVPFWPGLQLIWEEQSRMTLRHYPNGLGLPN